MLQGQQRDAVTAATRAAPRRQAPPTPPRQVPARAPARAAPRAAPSPATRTSQRAAGAPRRRGRAVRRFFGLLALAIVFTAAVAIAVILATDTSSQMVHLRRVVAHDANTAINDVRNIINGNSK
jgi:hypothetical protein